MRVNVLSRVGLTSDSMKEDHILFKSAEGGIHLSTQAFSPHYMFDEPKHIVFNYGFDNKMGVMWFKDVKDGDEKTADKLLDDIRKKLKDIYENADKEAGKLLEKNGFKKKEFNQI